MTPEITSKLGDLDFKKLEVPIWANFKPEVTEKNNVKYLKKQDNIYIKADDGYSCSDCGSEIKSKKVAHPIHDGPFPLSGSGKCHYEEIPYCPKCEEEPNFSGTIINKHNEPSLD